jgi:hypothetical protein
MIQLIRQRNRYMVSAVLLVALVGSVGCSGSKSRKAPGPAESEAKRDPCQTECCCRVDDGYYRRFSCTTKVECATSGGECLAADAKNCRL